MTITMKQMKRYITEKMHYAVLLLLMLTAGVQVARADNTEFEQKYNFMIIKNGQASLQFRLLTWAYGSVRNHYAGKGSKVWVWKYQVDGNGKRIANQKPDSTLVLEWWGWNDEDKYASRMILRHGAATVTNAKDSPTGFPLELNAEKKLPLKHTDKHTFLELDWFPPQEMLIEYGSDGKIAKRYELQFKIVVKDEAFNYSKERPYEWCYNLSDDVQGVRLSDPVFYPMGGEAGAGKIAIPYSLSSEPISYHTTFDHVEGKESPGEKNIGTASGMIYVNAADTVYSSFMIYVKAWRNRNTSNEQWNLMSNPVLLPAYHRIHNFKVEEYIPAEGETKDFYTGDKRLTWEVHHADETDIMADDIFVIERAYERDFSDARQIGSVLYQPIFLPVKDEEGKKVETTQKYEYVDQGQGAWYNPTNPEKPIYYRVRRASSQNWGWNHDWAARGSIISPVYLAAPSREIVTTVQKAADFATNRKVQFTISMDDSCVPAVADHHMQGGKEEHTNIVRNLVWNSSASLNLVRIMAHKKGEPGDTVRIAVLANSIVHDTTGKCWRVTVTDTPNFPCTYYSYMVEVKTRATTNLLRLTPEHIKDIQAPTIEGSSNDYVGEVTGSNRVPDYSPVAIPCQEDFYFDDAAEVTHLTASTGDYNDRVELRWETTGGESDFFEVYRMGSNGRDVRITDGDHPINKSFYVDSTAVGGEHYKYSVTSVVQCNGSERKVKKSAQVEGFANREAHIFGKLFYTNGMAIGGITMAAVFRNDTIKAVTKADGTYEIVIKERPRENETVEVFPLDSHGYNFTLAGQGAKSVQVNVGDTHKNVYDCNFQSREYVHFGGRVLYEGTSVPVPNAGFLISGQEARNTYGKEILTDSQGEFELTVPKGMSFTLRARKKGHTFAQDGYFMMTNTRDELDSVLYFTEDQNLKYMYDRTKVRLIGRVVGGDKQGRLPLGLDLSVNNLGDDLQMVFALEGNDVARLVYEESDKSIKERNDTILHEDTTHHTLIHTEAKRIVIHPDPISGEYVVDLLPVKYKVTQATAKGYSTLFDKNTGAAVVDLTDKLETFYLDYENGKLPFNDAFSIIYHAPLQLTYQQSNYGRTLPYYGEEEMQLSDFGKEPTMIKLLKMDKEDKVSYTFGHPVFNGVPRVPSVKNRYSFEVSAHEDYYYNNDPQNHVPDMVYIPGGKVKVSNGFDVNPSPDDEYITLDSQGKAIVTVTVDNPTFRVSGEDALRQLDFSMDYNGEQVCSEPLRAFVTAARELGTDVIGNSINVLDVLRDPPGSDSYSWLEAGTTYSGAYSTDISYSVGANLEMGGGHETTTVTGLIAGGTALQAIEGKVGNILMVPFSFVYGDRFKNAYSYTYTTSQRIQTSSAGIYVGNAGNVYIGTEISTQLHRYKSISVIDQAAYERVAGAVRAGEVRVLAEGADANGKPIYLVISDQISFSSLPKSDFAYTQRHIIKNLLPELYATRNALLQIADSATVQRMADAENKVMYWSKVLSIDDINFGTPGSYRALYPNGGKGGVDEVANLNNAITDWVNAIALNERLTLEALSLASKQNGVNVSAGTFIQHSEQSQTSYSYSTPNSGYQALNSVVKMSNSTATKLLSIFMKNGGLKTSATNGSNPFDKLTSSVDHDKNANVDILEIIKTQVGQQDIEENLKTQTNNCNFGGVDFRWQLTPVLDFNDATNAEWDKKGSRSVGYKIEEGGNGHISVGVYRTPKSISPKSAYDAVYMPNDSLKGTSIIGTIGDMSTIFKLPDEETKEDVNFNKEKYLPASFVFLRYGGATRCPYEAAEYTYFYMPGTKMSNATLKIDNPRIQVTNPVVSGVAEDEPAVFDLILQNDSEAPDADEGLVDMNFTLTYDLATNPNGARLFLDGTPLTNGLNLVIPRGEAIHAKLEVYRGTEDDYENIRLQFFTSCEYPNRAEVNISAHFLPTSSPVNLSTPTDKWIMNTLSPQEQGKYYIPVKIDGFNTDYRNFDHIELQYKRSAQPDDAYVNVCSFYVDEQLYEKASGQKRLFKGSVIDNIYFYGDNDPIEQNYDLRAVTFCRLGNSFVTRSSKVLSGVKDTRLPEVFGALSPKDGILGRGDYIGIPFSEDIAGNHLDKTTNFEVMGYTNKTGIVSSTSLVFSGQAGNSAQSEVSRNLSDKDFTIDMMVQPNGKFQGRRMAFFSQGTKASHLEIGGTADDRLYVTMVNNNDSMTIVSDDKYTDFVEWSRVAVVYEVATGRTTFYRGNTPLGSGRLPLGYGGAGRLVFGNSLDGQKPYAGNMLEARVWVRALTQADLTNTDRITLTGYERKLLAYYPMNEGKGAVIDDKANGASLHLGGQTWRLPSGRSLHFDGKRGVQLDESLFRRSSQDDYMLGLWFKAEPEQPADTVAFYAEGSGRRGDKGLFIGLHDKTLAVAQNGYSQHAVGDFCDGNWHHLVLSVNRLHDQAKLYVDGLRMMQFAADSLGALGAQRLMLGAYRDEQPGEQPKDVYCLNGNIDDIMLWETVMSDGYMKHFENSAPGGAEKGLLVNLLFSTSKANGNNFIENAFDPRNQLVKKEANSTTADKVIVTSDYAKGMSDALVIAPVREKDLISTLKFSFASKDNELVINLLSADEDINKQNVFITVSDVEDMAGNTIASPINMTLFVDRNQLKWEQKYVMREVMADLGDTFSVDIHNHGGTLLNYQIEDLPAWLEVDEEVGYLAPTDIRPVRFRVKDNLNPGEHTALVYLTDENGLSEPLFVTVNVKARMPEWKVDRDRLSESMNIIASVKIDADGKEYYDTDAEDLVAAFVGNVCVGVQNIDTRYGLGSLFMTVYGNDTGMDKEPDEQDIDVTGKPITFRLWRARTGVISNLALFSAEGLAIKNLTFRAGKMYGSPSAPIVMVTQQSSAQLINLARGWNWVSFGIKPYAGETPFDEAISQSYNFTVGDLVKTSGEYTQYDVDDNGNLFWGGTLTFLDHKKCYMFRVAEGGQLEVSGSKLSDEDLGLTFREGWNYLPYFGNGILSLKQALADFTDADKTKVSEGDIVKSYTEFAVWSDGNWYGSLTDLRPGQGYMLLKHSPGTAPFHYPKMEDLVGTGSDQAEAPRYLGRHSGNMTVVAAARHRDGSMSQEGDLLQAYCGNVLVGEAIADAEGRFYLMTSAENGQPVSFRLTRASSGGDSEATASTVPILDFDDETAIGSVTAPLVIDFADGRVGAGPNPFHDVLTFHAVTRPGDEVAITVCGAAGNLLFSHSDTATSDRYQYTTGRLAGLPQGVYFVSISVNGKNNSMKIIKL